MRKQNFINKHPIKSLTILIVAMSLLHVAQNANELFEAPREEQLKVFQGYVSNIYRTGKNSQWFISVENEKDKITAYLPNNCVCNSHLKDLIKIGDSIVIHTYRSNIFSSIKIWSIRSDNKNLLEYTEAVKKHTGSYKEALITLAKYWSTLLILMLFILSIKKFKFLTRKIF